MVARVFISYAEPDTRFAHRLAEDLRRRDAEVWIAPESIRPGDSWVEAIERGLSESSHMVIVLTPAALKSKWVQKEIQLAIDQERKGRMHIIPLDVKHCKVPPLLRSYQMISFRRDYSVGLDQLANILNLRVIVPETPIIVSETAKAEEAKGKPLVPRRLWLLVLCLLVLNLVLLFIIGCLLYTSDAADE